MAAHTGIASQLPICPQFFTDVVASSRAGVSGGCAKTRRATCEPFCPILRIQASLAKQAKLLPESLISIFRFHGETLQIWYFSKLPVSYLLCSPLAVKSNSSDFKCQICASLKAMGHTQSAVPLLLMSIKSQIIGAHSTVIPSHHVLCAAL